MILLDSLLFAHVKYMVYFHVVGFFIFKFQIVFMLLF
jgi:hypothetical protein